MELTQSFRLTGTTEIVRIPIQHIEGQNVIYWESIEQAFHGVEYVKNGDVAIPCCIKYFPGVVLDVVISSATEHAHVDYSVGAPSMVPTIVLNSTLAIGRTNAVGDAPTEPSSEVKFVEDLRITSALAETPIGDTGTPNPSTDISILPPSLLFEVKMSSKPALSFMQVVKLASKKANESNDRVQQQEFSSSMAHMIKLQEASAAKQEQMIQLALDHHEEKKQQQKASDAKQEEMNRLQKQALDQQEKMKQLALAHQEEMKQLQKVSDAKQEEMKQLALDHRMETNQLQKASDAKQEEMKQLQKQALDQQKEMKQLALFYHEEIKQLQIQALGQLAMLQDRVKAMLNQTYELHEYPIPRLFVVLPQDPSRWNSLDPFSNKFRLYFLCECGEHTKSIDSKTEIHFAKHEGYEIARPTEFFQRYGSHVFTILKMLKF
ncbi:hypothetical protein BGX24_005275, partial [Mortierella sp. AD032]